MSRSELQTVINDIRKHSRQLVRELDVVKGVYLGTGYTFIQCHVLFELAAHGALGLVQLAEILVIDKSNTSRTVKKLVEIGLVKSRKAVSDHRQKSFSLTAKGRKALQSTINLADSQVESAIRNLSADQQQTVIQGLQLYGNALQKSRLQSQFEIRPIRKADNPKIANVIRGVMTEFGAVGDGYSIEDPEVDDMSSHYQDKHSCYFVVVREGKVVGGGGIGPLAGGTKSVCELRKMFFLPVARGLGIGQDLLSRLMDEARERGYRKCYLETLKRMEAAGRLYQKNGFKRLTSAMGNTGHCGCDAWYLRNL